MLVSGNTFWRNEGLKALNGGAAASTSSWVVLQDPTKSLSVALNKSGLGRPLAKRVTGVFRVINHRIPRLHHQIVDASFSHWPADSWVANRAMRTSFSSIYKINYTFFGYSDPENIFLYTGLSR